MGPSYGLAKDTIWTDPSMLPNYIPDWRNANSTFIKKRETEIRVDFLQSGGQLHIYGADRPDLMRGPNPMGVVLDEYAVQKKQVWEEIVQPIMRANSKAWCWFLFTPRGKNHAFTAFQLGQDSSNDEWKSWKLPITQSGIFDLVQIKNARLTMSQMTFNQEFMCEFLEGEGSVFRNVKAACTSIPRKPIDNHFYVLGVDLAKVQDYTVIVVYDRATNAQVYQDRFQTLEWPFQKKRIKAISDHYNKALTIIDSTGLGSPIYDDLIRAEVPVLGYKITEPSKKDLIEKLSISIDQKHISMIPIEDTLFEFENFTYEQTLSGKIYYGAPQGFHDDIVIAHALAVWSLQPLYQERIIKPKTLIQKEFERRKEENQMEMNE